MADGLAGMTIIASFEARRKERPDAVAVVDGNLRLTYRELGERVNFFAQTLLENETAVGDVVAIAAERGVGYITAVLGTLAAGATCLPLNPGEPDARLKRILESTDSRLVIASQPLPFLRHYSRGLSMADFEGRKRDGAARRVAETSTAFIFSTSGSTGEPKNVALSHRSCISGLEWARSALGLGSHDRHLFRTAPNFVTVLRQVIWPLSTGGSVVVLPPGQEADMTAVVNHMDSHDITVTTFIPSALRIAVQLMRTGTCSNLRHVLCGAEPLPQELRRQVQLKLPDAALHNLYAPTEAPVVTHHPCLPTDDGVSPLGSPVAGSVIRVRKNDGELAGPGDDGELLVGGPTLASGYVTATGLDTDMFIPDMLGEVDRLFPTGDLVRLDADGTVRYVARMRDYVKVRGYRVEPGELERAALLDSRIVDASALVSSRGDTATLTLFVEVRGATSVDEHLFFLRTELPSYLLPDRIIIVAAIPRLPNGKIDRMSLDDLRRSNVSASPRDPLEQRIHDIWARVLGLETIGVNTTFRELGGDSLSAVEISLRLDEVLNIQLPSKVYLTASTIAELADAAEVALLKAGRSRTHWRAALSSGPESAQRP